MNRHTPEMMIEILEESKPEEDINASESKSAATDSSPKDLDDRITQIIVKKNEDIPALNDESYSKFPTRPMHLRRGEMDRTVNYYDAHNLKNSQKLEIVIDDGEVSETVELPPGFSEKIAEFLRVEHLNENDFDCSAFVKFVNGFSPDSVIGPAAWDYYPLEEAKPGDSIFVAKEKDDGYHAEHFAIALGHNLYLSQLGPQSESGRLSVMTLEEMLKGYHADAACKIVPKKKGNSQVNDEKKTDKKG